MAQMAAGNRFVSRLGTFVIVAMAAALPGAARGADDLLDGSRWRIFSDPQQLSSLYVNDFAHDFSGNVWHDGTRFSRIEDESDLPASLPADVAYSCVLTAVDGTLWAGTSAGMIRNVGQRWRRTGPSGAITAITESADGSIWAGLRKPRSRQAFSGDASSGVLRYRHGEWKLYGRGQGLPDGRIASLCSDADGGVWAMVRTDQHTTELYRIAAERGRGEPRWRNMSERMDPPRGTVLTMTQTRDGAYWFGTREKGVWRWQDGEWETFSDQDVASLSARSLLPMPDGSLWAVGSPAGTIYAYSGGEWRNHSVRDIGIAGRTIAKMAYALDDAFWFILPGRGVARFDRRGGPWWTFGPQHGLPATASIDAIASGAGDTLRIGTTEGLYIYDGVRFVSAGWPTTSSDHSVSALLSRPDGSVWVAGGSRFSLAGIWRYDGKWSPVATPPALSASTAIRAMLATSDDDVWVGTANSPVPDGQGAFRRRAGRWRRFTVGDGLPDDHVLSLAEGPSGTVWIGTAAGVAGYTDGTWTPFTASDGLANTHAWTICATRDGALWVGGNLPDAGVSRYLDGRWTWFRATDGLACDDVWSIVEAEDRSVWFGTARGITRYDGTHWTTFGASAGPAKDQVWAGAVHRDGSIWFGHFDGEISRFHATSTDNPRTYVAHPTERVPHPGSVTIEWTGRDRWDRSHAHDLWYTWSLDGGPWQPRTRATSWKFRALSHGRHTFRVAAVDQEQNVDPLGSEVALTVAPAFWLTWWFLTPTLTGIVGIAIAGSVAVQRNRRWKRAQARRMADLQREIEVAQRLQMDLLPVGDPVVEGLDIAGVCRPARLVGGDCFTFLWADEDHPRIGFAVADATGHAMQAAIPAVLFSGMLATAARQSSAPAEILTDLNDSLVGRTDSHTFVCCTITVIDTDSQSVSFASAGGLDILRRAGGTVDALRAEGAKLPLGMVPGVKYVERTLPLAADDTIVLLTDGIVEAMSPDGELLGFERVSDIIAQGSGAADTRTRLIEGATDHLAGREPDDDMTLVVVRVLDRALASEQHSHRADDLAANAGPRERESGYEQR